MNPKVKKTIQSVLEKLPFVQWDRYVQPYKTEYTFYGWIAREQDSYKDFVVLEFVQGELFTYITSSDKYSEEIGKILFGDSVGHSSCIRVEKDFDIDNMIKL